MVRLLLLWEDVEEEQERRETDDVLDLWKINLSFARRRARAAARRPAAIHPRRLPLPFWLDDPMGLHLLTGAQIPRGPTAVLHADTASIRRCGRRQRRGRRARRLGVYAL